MSTKCDCGDRECEICQGRSSAPAFVDPYLAAKAQADSTRKAQHLGGQPGSQNGVPVVEVAPPVPVVHVETPPVAQLAAAWQPPAHLQEETQRLLNTPVPPPPTPEQVAQREQELASAIGAPASPRKQQSPFAAAYSAWQKECIRRNEWIAAQYKELEKRQRARAEAIAQWDAHVAEAKRAWQDAKATLPPVAPRKEQFAG
jgi:hypothetical protein